MFIIAAAPPAAVSAPVWLEQPSAEEITLARAKYSPTDEEDALLQMTCYVQGDGRLTLCSGEAALLRLAPRYRLDRSGYSAPKVSIAVELKKLYDRPAVLAKGPTKADLIAIGGAGSVQLRCRVSETGTTGECEVDDRHSEDPPPAAPDVEAARKVAALYRYRPATLKGVPQPFYLSQLIELGDPDLIKRPNWLKKPSGEEFMNDYPKAAAANGVDGKATIECRVGADGRTNGCRVLSENPVGAGFGEAAVGLSSKFLMKPEMRNGVVFGDGKVVIPITFKSGGPASNFQAAFKVLSWAPFIAAPTLEQVVEATPAEAKAKHLAGGAFLRCEVTERGDLAKCADLGGGVDADFAAAAKRLTPLFKANVGQQPAFAQPIMVQLAFAFPSLPVSSALPRYIHKPDWVRSFGSDDVVAAYPPKAVAAGVLSGGAVLDCRIVAEGRLDACSVQTETPADLGFGEAASKVALAMQANLWTREGDPTVGARVKLPMKFVYSGDASPTPAAAR